MIKNSLSVLTVFILFIVFLTSSTCKPTTPCTTDANLFVGRPENPQIGGKFVFICPGESAGLVATSSDAQSASIDQDIGEIDLASTDPIIVSPTTDTIYTLTTSSRSCLDSEDEIIVNVVVDGDKFDINLNAPKTDPDTGVPENLIWATEVDSAFVTENMVVTHVELVSLEDACNWPKWTFRKTNTNGTIIIFSVSLEDINGDGNPNESVPTNISPPFPAPGSYEAVPAGLTETVAIANCAVRVKLTVRCR